MKRGVRGEVLKDRKQRAATAILLFVGALAAAYRDQMYPPGSPYYPGWQNQDDSRGLK
jgi:hypothetical protein